MNARKSSHRDHASDLTQVREITEADVLTWEIQFRREGTLPPEVQRRLLEHVIDRPLWTGQ